MGQGKASAKVVRHLSGTSDDVAAYVFGRLALDADPNLRFVMAFHPNADIATILDDAGFRTWQSRKTPLELDQIVLRAMHEAGRIT